MNHWLEIKQLLPTDVQLVAVSKYHSIEQIAEAYVAGCRDFGESRVQELRTKQEALPKDIRWHFIGHLQTNKVRDLLRLNPYLIQSVDSERLLANKVWYKISYWRFTWQQRQRRAASLPMNFVLF